MANSIPNITRWKEELMYGRLKKGFTEDESTKQIYQSDNYQIVSYPSIVNGKCNRGLKVELQHVNENDVFSESEIAIIKKYLPNYHIDHLQNVYPSKKAMKDGVKTNPMLDIFRLQQIQIELEEENILKKVKKSLDISK